MEDYLPISMLNQLEYCERRFYLMYVRGEMEVNAHVLEGALQHEQVHQAGRERQGEILEYRRVYLWSEQLKVAGFADVVEEQVLNGERVLIPIEYKKGRMTLVERSHPAMCPGAVPDGANAGSGAERICLLFRFKTAGRGDFHA